jgi:hypothetical protein
MRLRPHGTLFAMLATLLIVGLTLAPAEGGAASSSLLFTNSNTGGVEQESPAPPHYTLFTLTRPETITQITTYHWNNGTGAKPGMIYILVPHSGGVVKAQSQASGASGQGNTSNASWVANFNVTLGAGQWQIWDSDPSTWSYDSQSGNAGFVWIYGHASTSSPPSSSLGAIRACFYNTGFALEVGPCSGKPGSTIAITLVKAIKSRLAKVKFALGTSEVVVKSLKGSGLSPGSVYTFAAPSALCVGPNSKWGVYAWDTAHLAVAADDVYGNYGEIGEFKITGC